MKSPPHPSKPVPADRTGHAPVSAVPYARVSSDEQRERQTIETQIFAAQQQCEREGIPLGKINQVEAVAVTVAVDHRPAGRQLLADARAGNFSTVLLYRVDRLGRADVISHVAKAHLDTLGVGLRSLTEPFSTATASGRFMFSI